MIEKCPADKVKILAQPVVEQYGVNVIRKPAKTLVMVRMRETVAKAEFYLGELLASEALVELEGVKGFSLLMGDDLDKAFSAAVLDALRRSGLPQWEASPPGLGGGGGPPAGGSPAGDLPAQRLARAVPYLGRGILRRSGGQAI